MRRWIAPPLLAALLASAAPAQEDAPPAEAPAVEVSIPAAAEATAERAAYEAAFATVKEAYRAIEALQTEYQTADATRQAAIQSELKTLATATQPKVDAMVEAALAAYKADPKADAKVTELLESVAEHRMVGRGSGGGGDQYEAALPLVEALVEGGSQRAELPLWGVLAALATNDFGRADKFAKLVEERGALRASPGESEEAQDTHGLAIRFYQDRARLRKAWDKEKALRDAEAAADDLPRVKLTTSKGEIVIELFENEAPTAVANFLTLVKKGFYDGVVFHRVLPRFMAQGGDPTGTGSGGPGYSIACECEQPSARMHFRGTLSMAHAGRDTGGSQFFLTFLPTSHLDGQHTAFGRVVEGWPALDALQRIDPGERGVSPDQIVKAEVLRDRGHAYSFKKLPGR